MNAPLQPEVLLLQDSSQSPLPLATEGVLRYVWEGQFGPMLIEVIEGVAYVNSQRVEPLAGESDADTTPNSS